MKKIFRNWVKKVLKAILPASVVEFLHAPSMMRQMLFDMKLKLDYLDSMERTRQQIREREINKNKADYFLSVLYASGITKEKRNPRIIVSLTSFPDRMYDIKYTLLSLLKQSLKPDEIILWLGEEQFPGREKELSEELLAFTRYGVSFKWTKDTKSYKKLLPSLQEFSDDLIVTADDDVYYPETWLEKLYEQHLKNPDCICAHRCKYISMEGTDVLSYNAWEYIIDDMPPSFRNFFTGVGGVLYPPHCLCSTVADMELIMKIAPRQDDFWFWVNAVLNGTKIVPVKDGIRDFLYVNAARELGYINEYALVHTNIYSGQNDKCMKRIIEWKGEELINCLTSEM